MKTSPNCTIEFFDTPVTKAIEAEFGSMKSSAAICLARIAPEGVLLDKVVKDYKAKYKREPNLEAKDAKTVAKRLIDWYNENYWNVDRMSEEDIDTDYASIADIEKGKQFVADIVLDIYMDADAGILTESVSSLNALEKEINHRWNRIVFDRIARKQNKSIDDVASEFESLGDDVVVLEWIRQQLGKDLNTNDKNVLAVWQDLNGSNDKRYIKEILANPKLVGLFSDNLTADDEVDNYQSDTEGNNSTEDGSQQSGVTDDTDKAINQANSHLGDIVNFTKHLTVEVRNYFNSLKKTSSLGVEDVNNSFGIPERMTAEECAKMLYSQGVNFTNAETMVEYIRKIGESVSGFETFIQVAKDLSNDVELRNQLFTVFAKTRVSKIMVTRNVVKGETTNTVSESNTDSDKKTAMLYDLRNNGKYSIINLDHSNYADSINKYGYKKDRSDTLSKLADKYKNAKPSEKRQLEKQFNDYLGEIVSLFRTYFPNISETAIQNYVELNDSPGDNLLIKIDNLSKVASELITIHNEAINSKRVYNGLQVRADIARKENGRLRASKTVTTKDDFQNPYAILNEPFVTGSFEQAIHRIQAMLDDYSTVDLNLNSTNANNKMSSDIINNSTITRLIKLLENGDNDILVRWGNDKLRSHHYKFSNLFIEERKGPNIIKYGIFRKTSTGLEVTDYAKDIFKFSLFDGSKNNDNGESATYSQMNSGDFLPTVYGAFHKTDSAYERPTIPLATYFLRTPSDAPKTFTFRGPKYDTSDLYDYVNKSEVKTFINNVIKTIDEIGAEFNYSGDLKKEIDEFSVSENVLDDILNHKKLVPYKSVVKGFNDANSNTVKTFIRVNLNPDSNVKEKFVILKVEGDLVQRGNKEFVKVNKVTKYANYATLKRESYPSRFLTRKLATEVENVIRNNIQWHLDKGHHTINGTTYENIPTRKINRNNVTFGLFRNKVKQELYNMLVAMHHIFEYDDNGNLVKVIEDGVVKPKVKADININELYDFYDKDAKGNLWKIKGKYAELVGNVFNSNIFTLYRPKVDAEGKPTGEMYQRNYLMEAISYGEQEGKINLFYGGALSGIRLTEGGEIVISQEAQNILDGVIENFLKDYLEKAVNRIRNNSRFISESTTVESVTNFAVNYRLALMNFDELLEGSTKFYKDSQTILKRAKEYQGSGVPYGIADYFEADSEPKREVETALNKGFTIREKDGSITHIDVQEKFSGTILEGLKCYNKFRAVTVFNSISTNHPALNMLKDKLIKEQGLSEKDALQLLFGTVSRNKETNEIEYDSNGNIISKGGYTGTKVNDAQSYITFKEWVRRVAAKGQLKKYMPLIERILKCEKTGEPVPVADLKEFVQIQKNFYYDLYYDDKRHMEVPRQIKNAEIVLIPSLIKGTELETVYNLMIENNIDQLNTKETSKAANNNVLRLWNDDGELTKDNIDNFNKEVKRDGVVRDYNYKYLYTQQETPQHLDAKNKAGIQLLKKIIDNIPNSGHPLSETKREFQELMSENIYDSYKELFDALEIKYAEDGSIESLNKRVFFDKLRQQLELRGMDKNMYDCVDIDADGNPRMPIIRNDILNTFESVVQSQFNNNITRQMLPGFHAAQGTNVGFRFGGYAKASKMTDEQLKNDEEFKQFLEEHKGKIRLMPNQKISDGIRRMFGSWLNDKFGKDNPKVSTAPDLHYHQDKDGNYTHYIEVKLPLSAFGIDRTKGIWKNMSDKDILEILKKEGLDEIIGYRIPTEGKQSMAIMKVVGFTPDAMGSTIIVPNDWVSQTGSDFDIDSVYGIQFNTYFDKDGMIHKITYDNKKKPNYVDYYKYVRHLISDEEISEDAKQEIKAARSLVEDDFKEIYTNGINSYKNAVETIDKFSDKSPNFVEKVNSLIKNATKAISKRRYDTGREFEAKKYASISKSLESFAKFLSTKKNSDEKIKAINDIITACENLIAYFNDSNITEETAKEKIDILQDNIEKAGIMSYKEWSSQSTARRATRKERDNGILDRMMTILKDDSSLEEQLSRSNFDDISNALSKMMSANLKGERSARSPYDIFDQIDYQEDAMSGAMLKAFSVSMDTFCSVCNTVRPKLSDGSEIFIVYDRGDIENVDKAVDDFNTDKNAAIIDKDKNTFFIKHKTYGWSKSNKNVVGKILTSYSSQTTAHILDAIKEGAVPNVNRYTFGVYKTLANLGVDYDTNISFMMQPGIGRIVSAYNAGNSLFYESYKTPLEVAVRSIAKDLGVKIGDYDSVSVILRAINDKYKNEFNEIFKQDKDVHITLDSRTTKNIPIKTSLLQDRLNGTGIFKESSSPVEEIDEYGNGVLSQSEIKKLLFDLGTIIQFNRIQSIAGEITGISTVCNPDKFGAGKSMYAANNFFNRLYKALYYDDTITATKKDTVLEVDGVNMLEKIYPGCTTYGNDTTIDRVDRIIRGIREGNIDDSSYMMLAAHAKYGTAFSIAVGREILPTQSPEFVKLVNRLSTFLSNTFDDVLSEELFNDFQKYILNYLYNNVPSVKNSWKFITDGKGNITNVELEENSEDKEKERIFGYNHSSSVSTVILDKDGVITSETPFNPVDKNNPTQDEINQFAELSPAQKVKYIQSQSIDGGIFDYLEAELFNPNAKAEKQGMHVLRFNDTGISLNTIRAQFMNAVNSKNPLIKMAALDLVKYAVKVEGLRLGKSNITKVIDDAVLYNNFGKYGYNFANSVTKAFNDLYLDEGILSSTSIDSICETYLRSKPEIKEIKTFKIGKTDYNLKKYGIAQINNGNLKGLYIAEFVFNPNDKKDENETEKEQYERQLTKYKDKLYQAGILKLDRSTRVYTPNSYIKIVYAKGNTRLYKIKDLGNAIAMYPLHQLMTNETATWSANEQYNLDGYYSSAVYEAITNAIKEEQYEINRAESIAVEIFNSKEFKDGVYVPRTDVKTTVDAKTKELQQKLNKDDARFKVIKDKIKSHFIDNKYNIPLYAIDSDIAPYISENGEVIPVVSIKFDNNERVTVEISKPSTIAEAKKQLGDDLNDRNKQYVVKVNKKTAYVPSTGVLSSSFVDDDPTIDNLIKLDEKGVDFMKGQRASFGNEEAITRLEKLRVFNVTSRRESIKNNADLVTQQLSIFANKHSRDISDRFDNFYPKPNTENEHYSVLDDEVQELLKDNQELQQKYFKLLDDIQAFKDTFKDWDQMDSKDEELKSYINVIQKAHKKISKLKIDEADKKLVEGYIKDLSTNPLVKQDLVEVMGGFYKTTGSMWAFHDILENGNILLQTILKDVMGDIESKRVRAITTKRAYRNKIKEIIKAAKAEGLDVDLNKFITQDGRFVEDYAKEFIDTLERLRDAKNDAASEFGYGSIEHLRAKNEYDTFKAKHVNQQARPEYYINKAKAEKKMIEDYPVLYSHYMTLYYEKLDRLNFISETGLDDATSARLSEIDEEMYNLRRPNYYVNAQGQLTARASINQPNLRMTPDIKRELDLYSIESARIMEQFTAAIQRLNDKYFEYVPVAGFEQKLKSYLKIISESEKRVNGVPTIPMDVLRLNDKYMEAKKWIKENAYFKLNDSRQSSQSSSDENDLGTRIHKALDRLFMSTNGKLNDANAVITKAESERKRNNQDGLRDEYGIVDATKLTDDELRQIKEKVEAKYHHNQAQPFTDRVLINSAPRTTDVYKPEFYDPMKTHGQENPKYYQVLTQLNNILRKYYNEFTDSLDFSRMDGSYESVEELNAIYRLMTQLQAIRRTVGGTNGKSAREWIEEHCDYDINQSAFNTQFADTSRRDTMFKQAWARVNCELDENGKIILDSNGRPKPNKMLYGVMKPKDEYRDEFLDVQRTEDMKLLEDVYRTVPTRYYDMARANAELEAKNNPNFNYGEWFAKNHVYNPYTHKMEPLPCWVKRELKTELFDEDPNAGQFMPKASQREKKVKDGKVNGLYVSSLDMRNNNYNPNLSNTENYTRGSGFDNPASSALNKYEIEMRDYLKYTLMQTATVDSAKRYFQRGFLPARAKQPGLSNGKTALKEVGKLFGVGLTNHNGEEEWFEEISYSQDVTPLMPLTKLIRTSDSKEFKEKKPVRSQFSNDAEGSDKYNKALEEWKKQKKEVEDYNRKIHNDMLDKEWLDVIEDYLDLASRYNAINDNKVKLYYLLDKLRKQKAYIKSYSKGSNLVTDDRRGDEDNPVYATSVDNELIKQYKNFLRRLLFDQWKDRAGRFTKYANNIQGFASANYMMLNVKGGIANITLGRTGMLAEAAAGEFMSYTDWKKGELDWTTGIISYFRAIGKDYSYTVQDAIIKTFNVVDYDEHTGVVREAEYAKRSKMLRDIMFSPQSMGEHFMQNSVLFAMLHSHKLIDIPNDPRGIGCTFMNKKEYIRIKEFENIAQMLSPEQLQKFEEYKNKIKANEDELASYAWFRKDPLMRFVRLECTKEQRKKFIADRDKLRDKLSEEFDKLPNMRNQMKLGDDGRLAFVTDSKLDKLSKEMLSTGTSKADRIIGDFTQRVRLTNNKIHGVYNRLGSAYIEKTWIGSLVMQYHKHLPMGLMKRYMSRGHYNETRGSVDKGMIWSVWDFLTFNAEAVKHDANLTDANVGAIQGIQNILGMSMSFLLELKDTYSMLTDYDKANIRRNLGDLTGVLLACLTVLLLSMGDDDDDNDGYIYNLVLYEADRLASESFLYNPYGLVIESKKLMSTPIAAQSIITDAISTCNTIAGVIMQGEDYDPYYHSGRFAGEHKALVYLQRRIPMWAQIRSIIDLPSNNNYYKVGKNPIGLFQIKKYAKDED